MESSNKQAETGSKQVETESKQIETRARRVAKLKRKLASKSGRAEYLAKTLERVADLLIVNELDKVYSSREHSTDLSTRIGAVRIGVEKVAATTGKLRISQVFEVHAEELNPSDSLLESDISEDSPAQSDECPTSRDTTAINGDIEV